MTLVTFAIPPDQASYSVKDGNEVISTKLDGGASRYRRDILGSSSRVSVQWTIGPDEYKYIRSFYRATTTSGSTPFSIDLILDESYLTTHKAYFVPDSISLNQQFGLTYIVSAQLEVFPAEVSPYAADFVSFYNEFGQGFKYYENLFDIIINTNIPEIML